MSHSVFDIIENIDIILPVPLHPSRLRHRHYNQAALLGKYVGENWGRPFQVDVLKRHRPTPPQGHLTQGRRWKNVQGAFHVPSHRASLIKGARILLVDDVFTTGATLHACARALRQGGAQNVSISVACRVLPT
jgi:ComF family protein